MRSQTRLTYSDSRNNDERIVWNVVGGQTYYLRVFGYGGRNESGLHAGGC